MDVVIAGAGIGGLTAALALHRAGHRVRVFEAAAEIKELGLGINLQPHAVRELDALGLMERVLAAGHPCVEWAVFNSFGQKIWVEPRGTRAGHDWPQISIHRGKLQGVLRDAVTERLGADAIETDRRLTGFTDSGARVTARFAARDGGATEAAGDILIGADGLHSTVRSLLYPGEGAPRYNGATLWRGMTRARPFLSGGSQTIAGRPDRKFIVYPVGAPDADGMQPTNWLCELRTPARPGGEEWNRAGRAEDLLPLYRDWRFDWLDVPALIAGTETIYEFPMMDREPVPRWSFGRVTLLGDAAHPMVPIGANGGSQAIRDATAIADALATEADAPRALAAYDRARGPATAALVRANRQFVLDEVMQIAHERAPNGFADIAAVLSREEMEDVARRYQQSVTWAKREGAAEGSVGV